MTAPESGNKKLTGVTIIGRLKPGKTATLPYLHDETVYDYTWTVLNLNYMRNVSGITRCTLLLSN